jgi:subtilisin family serine protease
MATPQVTGAVALVRARNPGLSADATIVLMKRTARRSGGYTKGLGWGILDAGAAVGAALGDGGAPGGGALGKDVTDPSSRVVAPKRSEKRRFKLKIRFSDAQVPGDSTSGVSKVKVFFAVGKRGFKLLKKTTKHSIRFRGQAGKRYRFRSRAIDGAGNRERVRKKADSATLILG